MNAAQLVKLRERIAELEQLTGGKLRAIEASGNGYEQWCDLHLEVECAPGWGPYANGHPQAGKNRGHSVLVCERVPLALLASPTPTATNNDGHESVGGL